MPPSMPLESSLPPKLLVDATRGDFPSHEAGVHSGSVALAGFTKIPSPAGFCPLWHSYRAEGPYAYGEFHACAPSDRWQISIHDFTPIKDTLMEFKLPEYLSVAWYDSISGEEFAPYRKLRSKSLWGFYSGEDGWRGLVHGGISVRSVSIEVTPEMSREYLEREYDGQFEKVREAYAALAGIDDFPEMRALLTGLWPRPGDEKRSTLYYEGKIFEALGLIVERSRSLKRPAQRHVSEYDRARILEIASFVDDHCASTLSVPTLAQMGCMSPTKFKSCFKAVTGQTLTAYLQGRRMAQAEQLLRQPDLTIAQVSRAVGYSCASRFSELFRRETGLMPSEYRARIQ